MAADPVLSLLQDLGGEWQNWSKKRLQHQGPQALWRRVGWQVQQHLRQLVDLLLLLNKAQDRTGRGNGCPLGMAEKVEAWIMVFDAGGWGWIVPALCLQGNNLPGWDGMPYLNL